jgi:hypothetical protein
MSFIVDILAMTFGRPHALFPAVGVLLGGAVTVGVLTGASAVGTLASSLFSGRLGGVRRQGVAIGWAIAVYGLFVLGFGVVLALAGSGWFDPVSFPVDHTNLPALVLGAVMLVGTGATDNVSAVYRNTMLQTAVADKMWGHLQGIFTTTRSIPRLNRRPAQAGMKISTIETAVATRPSPSSKRASSHMVRSP